MRTRGEPIVGKEAVIKKTRNWGSFEKMTKKRQQISKLTLPDFQPLFYSKEMFPSGYSVYLSGSIYCREFKAEFKLDIKGLE